jgi:succinoglycan biosynthesis protein ExoA
MAVRSESTGAAEGPLPGVSFVIPVRNGKLWLGDVVGAIRAQHYPGPTEIIVVEDGSTDGSRELLERLRADGTIRLIEGERRGAAAAMNVGIRAASHPLIAQVDQDVVLAAGWLGRLASVMHDPSVGAAQGHYVAAPDAGPWSRVMALDLRQRYSVLENGRTNHVCTGNSIYRASALLDVGLFEETLGYGYDNDMSYRLVQAGYQLAFRADAISTHHWREGLVDYARQQYGFGYGRLDLVDKHRRRVAGDNVSRIVMMLHAPVMAACCLAALAAGGLALFGLPARVPALIAAVLLGVLAVERLVAGIRAAVRFRDSGGLLFVPIHLVRDVAWAAAIAVWGLRRLRGGKSRPINSMRPRSAGLPERRTP